MAQMEKTTLRIMERKEEFIRIAKDIFEHPECALEEKYASEALTNFLARNGFSVTLGVAGLETAFEARRGSGKPVLGFLAEYDALPGLHQEPVSRRCGNNGPGHGCGHHLLGAGCAAAAIAVADQMKEEDLPGTIIVYGCPAEEIMCGKVVMGKSGCFDQLDAAITWHPFARNRVSEDVYQAMDSVKFHFSGTASHAAAMPELGRSALDAAELMNVGVNYLREHVPDDVRMHYIYTNGGEKPNIVPDRAEVWYYLRANSRKTVDDVRERVLNIARGAALMTGTSAEMELLTGCSSTKLNTAMNQVFYDAMARTPLPTYTDAEMSLLNAIDRQLDPDSRCAGFCQHLCPLEGHPVHISGSTDVSDVSVIVPTVTLNAAAATYKTPMHHWTFTAQAGSTVGYKAMLYAAQCMAAGTMELLRAPEKLAQIKAEFEREQNC